MALGKIKADTLEHSTAGSVDTKFVVNGSEKVWVNFNGTGTVAIRDSLNTSSITDVSTGRYRPNYTNSFNYAADYAFHVTSGVLGATWGLQQLSTHTASSTEFILYDTSGGATDNSIVPCTARGDLA